MDETLTKPREPSHKTGWTKICKPDDIPLMGARVIRRPGGDIAVFRNANDEFFALLDRCPHKGGPLSQGIVFGRSVACPLHSWIIRLEDGRAEAPDSGCTRAFPVKVENGELFLQLSD